MSWRRFAQIQVFASAACFSTAGLFMGLIDAEIWTVVFWRSLFALAFTCILMTVDTGRNVVKPDRAGLVASCLSAGAMLAFIAALRLTAVANVAVIHGSLPLMAALLGLLIVKQHISASTSALCTVASLGAAAIFYGSASSGLRLAGDGLALLMTLQMALMTIAFQRSRTPSLMLVALSNALAASVAVLFAPALAVSLETAVMLACFAFVQMTLGLLFYTIGSRVLPVAETALITLAEVPMSVFWVWVAFGQRPGQPTVIGAGIILSAVLVYLAGPGRNPGGFSDAD
jgi:drug/metabolite transporter (DMT)-like permease